MGERALNYPISVDLSKLEVTFSFNVMKHIYQDIRDHVKKS
jgi:hypothetical protein